VTRDITDLPIESPNRKAFRYLGIALATSVIIAFPMEQVVHTNYLLGFGSCRSEVPIALTLCNIVQALLSPLLIFLLPGPGSILRKKISREPVTRPGQTALFLSAALLCAGAIPAASWYGLREYAAVHKTCGDLFDLARPVDIYHVGFLSNFAHYFIYSSVFSAFWVGITAGGLRLQSARAAAGDSSGKEVRQFQGFHWACFLGWAVQYRLTQWCFSPLGRGQTEWVNFALWGFITLTVSSLWVLAFIRHLWNKKPRTRREAVMRAFWTSLLIYLLTALTFLWSPTIAGGTLNFPLVTLNLFGFAWALVLGTWQWRALQKEKLAGVVPQI
jgi:hypothetical protein